MCTTGGQWDVSQDFGDCCLHFVQCLLPIQARPLVWRGGGMDAELVALLSCACTC